MFIGSWGGRAVSHERTVQGAPRAQAPEDSKVLVLLGQEANTVLTEQDPNYGPLPARPDPAVGKQGPPRPGL